MVPTRNKHKCIEESDVDLIQEYYPRIVIFKEVYIQNKHRYPF